MITVTSAAVIEVRCMTRQTKRLLVWAAVAVSLYMGMWLGYRMHWAWLDWLDSSALDWSYGYGVRHPGWVHFWDVVCTVAGPALRLLGVGVIVYAVLRRNLRAILFVLVTMALTGGVSEHVKRLADRPRPTNALIEIGSTAFPSGHAFGVMTAVATLLAVSTALFSRPVWLMTIGIAVAVVIAVGVGRVLLVVHQPSDVVAGWALGYLWFLACLVAIRPPPLKAPAASTWPGPHL